MLKICSRLLTYSTNKMNNFRGRGRRGYRRETSGDHGNRDLEEDDGGQNWRGHYHGRRGHRHRGQDHRHDIEGYNNAIEGHRGGGGRRQFGDSHADLGVGRNFRTSRPPGLRGKEIGMYYAKRGRENKQRKELNERPAVSLQGKEAHLKKLLADMDDSKRGQSSGASVMGTDDDSMSIDETSMLSVSREASISSVRKQGMDETAMSSVSREASILSVRKQGMDETALSSVSREASFSSVSKQEENTEESGVPQLDEMYKLTQQERDLLCEDWNGEMEADEGSDSTSSDQTMLTELNKKNSDQHFQKMMEFRIKLPSYDRNEEIVSVINSSQVTVISGETGCGKTTQVPQFILDDYIRRGQGSKCHIICTQPRRISAVSVALRVAEERAEQCGKGNSVGYCIRLEREMPRSRGSILFCTTGILIKYLESDPNLTKASHIIIDEIHERDLLSDFLMIILKDLLPRRPDLKVILMSATLNAVQFSKYFNNCPMLSIPGFTFPVTEYTLEDVLEMTKYVPPPARKKKFRYGKKFKEERNQAELDQWNFDAWCRNLNGYSHQTIRSLQNMDREQEFLDLDMIHSLIQHIVTEMEDGAILVFVPGWDEISNLHKILYADPMFSTGRFKIIPLHSLMPTINQRDVFNRPPPGVRKIVIATNIAETSITIDDVVFVIDCGKIKVKDFQPEQNLNTLKSEWVSKANARQRRGRAGRVQPGHCFHLYTNLKEMELRDYIPPEMLRTRLEELCLQIKLLKLGRIEPFVTKAMEKPSLEAVHKSIIMLQNLQALDKDENLLPLGYHLARMPVDPQSGKMIILGAIFGCLDPVCIIAASLSFKDAFIIPLGKEREADEARRRLAEGSQSDHIMLINAFQGWERAKASGRQRQYCFDNFLSDNTLKLLGDMKGQFADLLNDLGFVSSRNPKDPKVNINSGNLALVKAVICAGLYPNVAKLDKVPKTIHRSPSLLLSDRQKISVHPKSVNANEKRFVSKWFVYHKLMKTSQVYLYDMTGVSPYSLLFFGGKISMEEELFEGEMKDVVVVDDWVRFWCPAETALLVKKLRKQLDMLLEEKITKTGVTNWDKGSKEGALMHAIIDLITMEENNLSDR